MGWAFLILAILAAMFLWPLLKSPSSSADIGWKTIARALYRQRLGELKEEAADLDLRAELEDEIGASYLRDVEDGDAREPAQKESGHRMPRGAALGLMVLLPVAAFGLYVWLADPGLSQVKGAEEILALPASETERVEFWRARLQERTDQAPDDAKSLYLLGHAELKQDNFAAAASAFARTHQLNPEDTTVQVYWLQARFLANRGRLDDVSQQLAADILQSMPNMPVIMEMLALDAVQQQRYDEAVKLLNRGLSGAQDIHQQTNFVSAISELRKNVTMPGVTVDVQAAAQVPASATLFVIARPVGGGMPLAVVKLPALLLPQKVRLDDLVSMSDASKLTAAEAFEVVVRLSLAGTPVAQPTDWQWQSDPLTLPVEELKVMLAPPTS